MRYTPFEQAIKLIKVLTYFRSSKDFKLHRGQNCPFDDLDEERHGGLTHYTLSQAAAGLGKIRWNCPFCSKHFEE